MKIIGILLILVSVSLLGLSCYNLGKQDGRKEERGDYKTYKIKTFKDL